MDDDSNLESIAERLAATSVAIAGLMDYLARQGVGSHAGAAAHLRRVADLAAGDDLPRVQKAILRVADHIESLSGANGPPGRLLEFAPRSDDPAGR